VIQRGSPSSSRELPRIIAQAHIQGRDKSGPGHVGITRRGSVGVCAMAGSWRQL
jgi:hypothetical protein